jgi:Domain of unknown function (DUF4124)
MLRLLALCLLLCAAAPLGAQTYKWVDENGVVNYSNAPPPGAAGATANAVEDRVSTIPSDPSLGPAIAAMRAQEARRAELAEAEWLQRQRLLAASESAAQQEAPCPYRTDCGTPYGAVYVFPYFRPALRPPFRPSSFRHPSRRASPPPPRYPEHARMSGTDRR